jgi:Fic family protein
VFVPRALPPDPPLDYTARMRELDEEANRALGRLDGAMAFLPEPDLFLYSYVRKEAVLSAQIEGAQSTLVDLFEAELDPETHPPPDDVYEVSDYVAATRLGLDRLRAGTPLDSALIRDCHHALMGGDRTLAGNPGSFRDVQNWLAGASPLDAVYVPPPPEMVGPAMDELAAYVRDSREPLVIRAGLAHAQFESIHPFNDGNGRAGRLLITLMLCAERALTEPVLYLSLYLKEHRADYYDRLMAVRLEGDWEGWIEFYLMGVLSVAEEAAQLARRLTDMFHEHRDAIHRLGRAAPTALRLHRLLCRSPIANAHFVAENLEVSEPTARKAIESLEGLGYLRERTGKQRGRVYEYSPYLALLAEGTERTFA